MWSLSILLNIFRALTEKDGQPTLPRISHAAVSGIARRREARLSVPGASGSWSWGPETLCGCSARLLIVSTRVAIPETAWGYTDVSRRVTLRLQQGPHSISDSTRAAPALRHRTAGPGKACVGVVSLWCTIPQEGELFLAALLRPPLHPCAQLCHFQGFRQEPVGRGTWALDLVCIRSPGKVQRSLEKREDDQPSSFRASWLLAGGRASSEDGYLERSVWAVGLN